MVQNIGAVRLYGTIGIFDQASVLAIGNNVVVADVMRYGKLRYRQVLEGVKPEDVNFDAEIKFVSREMRRKLHHLFADEPMVCRDFSEHSEHKVTAKGDFVPLVRKGDILVADYNMRGTHYFRLSPEDRAWLLHQDGIEI